MSRSVALLSLSAVLLTLAGAPARAQVPPYPPSPFITGISFDWAGYRRLAQGSDNWPLTWASDGQLYAAWGDGSGLGAQAGGASARVSLGLARLSGSSAATLQGSNLIGGLNPLVARCMQRVPPDRADPNANGPCYRVGRHGKSWGVLALDNRLYLWGEPASAAKVLYSEARLYRAPRGTDTWTRAAWAFTPSDPVRVVEPTFLQAGRNYADLADYLYVYAIRYAPVDPTTFSVHRSAEGGQVVLMRVPKAGDPMRRENYEYFAGLDVTGAATWTRDPALMRPAFTDPDGVGWTVSATYVKALGRYLLVTEHGASRQGQLGLFEARSPWGPWQTVFYGTLTDGTARVPATSFHANFLPNGFDAVGGRFTLAFTGVGVLDALSLVDGRLALNEAFR